MGEAFTQQQLIKVQELTCSQPVIPSNLFMSDPSGILLGPGTVVFLVIRNCPSEHRHQDLINYWLKKWRQEQEGNKKVWRDMMSTVMDKKQRLAASQYDSMVRCTMPYPHRKTLVISILSKAITITTAKRSESNEYLV